MTYCFLTQEPKPALIVHRTNLVDTKSIKINPNLKNLVGSKSGVALIDSAEKTILIPPSAGVEVDFWIFAKGKIIISHLNPDLDRINEYPTFDEYFCAWQKKRELEKSLDIPHGKILANIKTHGAEEAFLEQINKFNIPLDEIFLLDEESPATDRLLRRDHQKQPFVNLAFRISRIESIDSLIMALSQEEFLEKPNAIFFDPIGCWHNNTIWPFSELSVKTVYNKNPKIVSIICCPSRWNYSEYIPALATRLTSSGLNIDYVMTDMELMKKWQPLLRTKSKIDKVSV